MLTISARKRGFSLIELLVVVLILAVLTAIAIPMYLRSVTDAEVNTCKTNMSSIAAAEQAQRVREVGTYYSGPVDSTATANDGPLRDLHNAVPNCPGDENATYTVTADGSGGFFIRCSNPRHPFQWHDGKWETY